jgi:hypothetical protein
MIRAKLKISQPNDKYEQEADRVAEQLMRMPEPQVQHHPEEEEKKKEEGSIRTKKNPGQTPEVTLDLESRIQALRGGGQPLPASTRAFFEPRFRCDFSQVRVHADARAADLACAVTGRAFTVGRDMFFGAGQYAPERVEGRILLAHELSHVVQQEKISSETENRILRVEAESGAEAAVETSQMSPEKQTKAVTREHAAYLEVYRRYLQEGISCLESAAEGAENDLFGRTVKGKCMPIEWTPLQVFPSYRRMGWLPIVKRKTFDARYWKHEINCETGESKLVQTTGTPAEAIDELFSNLDRWSFDCAEYIQVAIWYAQRHAMGTEFFNSKITMLGSLELKNHGSTGIFTKELYIRDAAGEPFYRENYITETSEPTDKIEEELLEEAPIGTGVTWTNKAALEGSGFRHENTIKVGEDKFAAHPWGTGNRTYIECMLGTDTLAAEFAAEAGMRHNEILEVFVEFCDTGVPSVELRNHVNENVFISNIKFYEVEK